MKNKYCIYICFELFMITLPVQISQCFKYGEYLDSVSYKEVNDIGLKQCAKRCYAEADCQSINFSNTKFTCTFSRFSSQQKQLMSHSEYIYGDRNHMAQIFPGFINCSDEHVLLKMHDGRKYCFKHEIQRCTSRLMWQNNSDVNISVSSTHQFCSIDRASLNYGGTGSAWCPASTNLQNDYIQINFVVTHYISAVITQGRGDTTNQYVTIYRIESSDDTVAWSQIGDDYTGNSDANTCVENILPVVVKTKYLRIIPVAYDAFYPSMRFDLIACRA